MSAEPSEVETPTAPAVADITQQATTPTPTQRVKNPKRVAASKRVADRTWIAREQQKKAVIEASAIIAKNAATPEPAPTTEAESPKGGLSVNQWIGIGSVAVGLAGIYYKREELKAAFKKIRPEPEPAPASVEPSPASVEPAPQRKGLTKMV